VVDITDDLLYGDDITDNNMCDDITDNSLAGD
jgi:hypothetical protein